MFIIIDFLISRLGAALAATVVMTIAAAAAFVHEVVNGR